MSREGDASLTMTHVGTPLFASPEVLTRGRYDASVDVWSFGCVLTCLSLWRPTPYPRERADHELLARIIDGDIRPTASLPDDAPLLPLVRDCCLMLGDERPTFLGLCELLDDVFDSHGVGRHRPTMPRQTETSAARSSYCNKTDVVRGDCSEVSVGALHGTQAQTQTSLGEAAPFAFMGGSAASFAMGGNGGGSSESSLRATAEASVPSLQISELQSCSSVTLQTVHSGSSVVLPEQSLPEQSGDDDARRADADAGICGNCCGGEMSSAARLERTPSAEEAKDGDRPRRSSAPKSACVEKSRPERQSRRPSEMRLTATATGRRPCGGQDGTPRSNTARRSSFGVGIGSADGQGGSPPPSPFAKPFSETAQRAAWDALKLSIEDPPSGSLSPRIMPVEAPQMPDRSSTAAKVPDGDGRVRRPSMLSTQL